jgi:hypothetical protein
MILSCSCEDFDKSDYDRWWEPGGMAVPPSGSRCVECRAPLSDEPCESFDHMEIWEPVDQQPPHPDTLPEYEQLKLSDADFTAMEIAHEDWLDDHGWDDECERFERCTGSDYRCGRCSDLAASIVDLGYCLIGPGELIDDHMEFIRKHGLAPRIWRADDGGTLNPHPVHPRDYVASWVRRTRLSMRHFLRYGWKPWLRWRVYERIRHPVIAYRNWKMLREYRRRDAL